MTDDGDPDTEETVSAEDLLERTEEQRQEQIEKATLDDCRQIRSAGKYVREADSWQNAVNHVADELTVTPERAKWLVGLYVKIFTESSKHVSSYGLSIGGLYFSTEGAMDDLQPKTDIDSIEEAQRYLREYVGAHVEEADLDKLEFRDELPEEPPYPFLDIQFPQLTGIADALNATQLIGAIDALNAIASTYQQHPAVQLSAVLDGFDFDLLFEHVSVFGELTEQYREIEESDFEFKWLSDVKYGAFMQLYRVYQEEGNEAAAERLAEQLRHEEDIEDFKEYFQTFDEYDDRQPIVDEVLDAHAEGRYALSIPTVLTQLDGVFIDTALDIGLWRPDNNVTGVEVVSKGEGSPRHISEIDDEFRDYYRNRVWSDRNDILHGKRTNYTDNEHLSAKLIWLFFQTLHTVENIRSVEDFGDYHILYAVAENDVNSLTAVANYLDYQEEYVERRCAALEDQQAVTVSENGELTLTKNGREYLQGDRSLNRD